MEVYMNNRKLSLIFAVSLTAMSAVQANVVFSSKLGRYFNTETGRMVSRKAADAVRALEPAKSIIPFVGSAVSTISAGASKCYNGAYGVVAAGVTGLMSGAEYLYDQSESAVEAAPVILEVAPTVIESVPAVIEVVPTVVKSVPTVGNKFTGYLSAGAVKNGFNAVVTAAKNNPKEAVLIAGLTATTAYLTMLGVKKALAHKATPIEKKSEGASTQAIISTATALTQTAPVAVQAAPSVVQPVVKLTVAQIVQKHGADLQGLRNDLMASGHRRADVNPADIASAGKLSLDQAKYIVSRIR
jgi:hypothetical protein